MSDSGSNSLNSSQSAQWPSEVEITGRSNSANSRTTSEVDSQAKLSPNSRISGDITMSEARSSNGARTKTDTAFNNLESLSPSHSISETDLRNLLSPNQSTYPITYALIDEYGLNGETRKSDSDRMNSSQANTAIANSAPSRKANINHLHHTDSSILRPFNKWEQILTSPHTSHNSNCFSHPIRLSIEMNAAQALAACKGIGSTGRVDTNLLSDDVRPPEPIEAPYPPLPKDKLLPSTPSVFVSRVEKLSFLSYESLFHLRSITRKMLIQLNCKNFASQTRSPSSADLPAF